jgi:hypothetical protein
MCLLGLRASPRSRIEDVQCAPLRQCHVEGGSGAFDQKSLNGTLLSIKSDDWPGEHQRVGRLDRALTGSGRRSSLM